MSWGEVWLGVLLGACFYTLVLDLFLRQRGRTLKTGLAVTFIAWLLVCMTSLPFIWLVAALRRTLPLVAASVFLTGCAALDVQHMDLTPVTLPCQREGFVCPGECRYDCSTTRRPCHRLR